MAPIRIVLSNLGHHFGTRSVFEKVHLEVVSGQIGAICGPNGAGKSTLLRIVAGLLTPTQGEARFEIAGYALDALERRPFIGYVAPDLRLYHELTGVENLQFFAELRGTKLSRDHLKQLLTRVGLLGRGSDLVANYSSGMRQRLKYALALSNDPPVLLLDEPTANLDSDGVAMVEQIIAEQCQRPQGGLVLIATNEPEEERWAHKLIRIGCLSTP
ncbi:ABC transporter ATP-binding protein [Chthonomonas calidirosea]|uniref:ABC transporter ATP-binding protein n=1 Tax=Chthonomonas calidirosea TaxID=454171 RepID=UPI0006ECC20E|nr:ABC transporter ATP-binding protein [Chthonomonas calidirosea]CEK15486.1 ABC-type multidrug transport system, ATPase component [Chthonomonas calidirosea]